MSDEITVRLTDLTPVQCREFLAAVEEDLGDRRADSGPHSRTPEALRSDRLRESGMATAAYLWRVGVFNAGGDAPAPSPPGEPPDGP